MKKDESLLDEKIISNMCICLSRCYYNRYTLIDIMGGLKRKKRVIIRRELK
jgi:hypothetical protein